MEPLDIDVAAAQEHRDSVANVMREAGPFGRL